VVGKYNLWASPSMLYIFRTAEAVAQINPFISFHSISFYSIFATVVSREVEMRLELGCTEMRLLQFY